ncbi:hypothetical protein CO230_08780 [Chryseobacterium sp. 6424]|uniref:hypothetical protein n=1 Tax=Chryseobacterium sp. 6424 TaxID=2039166 RepID=UPI000EFC538D|nr:hypothetical protein [Chryseobacterium sp. 6424]AYO58209.1 hypothetical protein CO230_08780 [Chryseobacterium sp. 6424]
MQLATCTAKQFNNQLARLEQNLTIRGSIEQSALICTEGQKKDVVPQIIRVIEFFLLVTGKEMEDFQITILAGDLYDRFRTDTLDDIILMLKFARTGEFGKVYSFNSMTVMEWAQLYLDRKAEERERLLRSARNDRRKELPEPEGKRFSELPPELQEKFNSLGKEKSSFKLIPDKAKEAMTNEKLMRNLQKENDD